MKTKINGDARNAIRLQFHFVFLITVFVFPQLLEARGSLLITWDANTEEDLAGYMLYYGTATCTYDSSVDVGNVTEHRIFGLTIGQKYFFVVTAYDQCGNESEPSVEVSEIVREPMTAVNNSGQDVHLAWAPVENADSYNVYWSTNPYFVPSTPLANVSNDGYVKADFRTQIKTISTL